ncbi:9133_t:CDS:1, partial [Gigaspora rosea]
SCASLIAAYLVPWGSVDLCLILSSFNFLGGLSLFFSYIEACLAFSGLGLGSGGTGSD